MRKRVGFYTLGCKVNSYETDAIRQKFEESGYDTVDFKEKADIYVINTCTVTNIADRKSRQMLHQAKKRNKDAIIIAVGCYVQAAKEELLKDINVDIIIGNNKKSEIINILESFKLNNKNQKFILDISEEYIFENMNVSKTADKSRIFFKIQEGCNRFCSYCIIPYVRGRIRSKKKEDILSEIKTLTLKGYKEFVLTGIHLSSYGKDFEGNNDKDYLGDLILSISKINGVERIRLGSLEPMIITKEFVDKLYKIKSFCPHFHLSLQSGSDSVLKRMNRRYTCLEFFEKVVLLKETFDRPSFTTDIIVGFPGETEEEFNETKEFIQKLGFLDIHVFKFSKREGTKAAKMDKQIPDNIKSIRSSELIKVADSLSYNYKKEIMDSPCKVLVEKEEIINGVKYYIGHNERYVKMAFKSKGNACINKVYLVKPISILNKEIILSELLD